MDDFRVGGNNVDATVSLTVGGNVDVSNFYVGRDGADAALVMAVGGNAAFDTLRIGYNGDNGSVAFTGTASIGNGAGLVDIARTGVNDTDPVGRLDDDRV